MKRVTANRSEAFRLLLEHARQIAVDLGYDYIGTDHLFLADCRPEASPGMGDFANIPRFQYGAFLERFRVGDTSIFVDRLQVTMDVERTLIKASELLQRHYYPDRQLQPYHYFLAAAHLGDTYLSRMVRFKGDFLQSLESFYLQVGILDASRINRSLKARLRSRLSAILSKP